MLTWKTARRIVLLILLLVAANLAGNYFADLFGAGLKDSGVIARWGTVALAIAYCILLAIPFVPGVEMGMMLMAIHGTSIALLVYLCTVIGLSIAFLAGRLVPLSATARFARFLRLERVALFIDGIDAMDREERLARLMEKAPNRAIPFLLRHRHIALALALNIPGNSVIGGGGGIALLAGSSRLFSAAGFLVAVALAVSPVPLAFYLFGQQFFPPL
ncbi:hypothetical protein [Oricola sp.]|uniref:hypothetical protein n=1 Tax=Oricola sp. TaxID=1979950 RepID=UPI000C92EACB|nr:hypothetical protein [Ahrensia sp.]|tara:strand:+ start:4500 stop:5150 length:651 start_codon:yes stop_codon:yes gene_type:complete